MMHKKLQGYGDGIQYSIFMCELNSKELVYMKEDLLDIANLKEDRILIINLGPESKNTTKFITSLGVPLAKRDATIVI